MKLDKVISQPALRNGANSSSSSEPTEDLKTLTFLKRKSTLTSESKDLLQRLNLLKKDMQKNVTTDSEHSIEPATSNNSLGSFK